MTRKMCGIVPGTLYRRKDAMKTRIRTVLLSAVLLVGLMTTAAYAFEQTGYGGGTLTPNGTSNSVARTSGYLGRQYVYVSYYDQFTSAVTRHFIQREGGVTVVDESRGTSSGWGFNLPARGLSTDTPYRPGCQNLSNYYLVAKGSAICLTTQP